MSISHICRCVFTHTDDLCAVQEQAAQRPLVIIAGFIHDVASFMDEHPGGRHLIAKMIGKDATTAFFGGIYDHSNAAHNVCLLPLPCPSNPVG